MFTPPPSPRSPSVEDDCRQRPSYNRLTLVSNRLPVTISRSSNGQFQYHKSSGGLVTCMSGLGSDQSSNWYGWPGSVESRHNSKVRTELMQDYGAVPVFLEEELASRHYNGFSRMSKATLLIKTITNNAEQILSYGLFYTIKTT
jgi:trehalose 6-phosphate synthase